jgi:hypothetical protein
MTEIERMIDSSARGCLTQVVLSGKKYTLPPRYLVKALQAALSKASESERLRELLERNDFKCMRVVEETRCHNAFKRIIKPGTLPFSFRDNTNPEFEETYITDVAFKQTTPGQLAAADIKVKFTRLTNRDGQRGGVHR